MLRKSFALALIVAVAVSSAQAAIVGTATLKGNPPGVAFTSPDAALGSPWVSYALDLSSTAGELIGGIDVTITGSLHQRWTFDEDSSTFLPTANALNMTNGDSHLRAVTGALFGSGPTENNPGTGSPLPDTATSDYGVGTTLSGAWGITAAATTATLAYIVVPADSIPTLQISVAVAAPTGDPLGTLTKADFTGFPGGGLAPVVNDFTDTADILNEVIATTITATNSPTSWGALTNPTYTPGFGALPGAAGIGIPATFNPATQAFSFNTAGSTRGTYTWNVAATNASGSDTGLITVNVTQVPEPASLALFGLALVGFVGVARRR